MDKHFVSEEERADMEQFIEEACGHAFTAKLSIAKHLRCGSQKCSLD
jgi:hypothetical protein